jgi:hypothetical protein
MHISVIKLVKAHVWYDHYRNCNVALERYTRKNAQVDALLMKTGLNNVLLPTLFTVVNNIEQYCYTGFRLNNTVQYC